MMSIPPARKGPTSSNRPSWNAYPCRVPDPEGQTAARPGRCANHPAVALVGTCEVCGRPLCIACAVPVRGRLIGPECLSEILEDVLSPQSLPRSSRIRRYGHWSRCSPPPWPWPELWPSSPPCWVWAVHPADRPRPRRPPTLACLIRPPRGNTIRPGAIQIDLKGAVMSQRPGFDLAKLSAADRMLVGGSLLLFIDSFLNWQRVCGPKVLGLNTFCATANAW